jgi:hypothetical protein
MRIEKERMVVEDTMDKLVEIEQGITCGCEKPSLTMTMHLDGTDFYQSNYVCQCGNQISLVVERNPEDVWM